jgi:ABC-2 type transport system ATP-binding protein
MIEADTLCDRLVIIDHGKAIKLDTPENLKSQMQYDIVSIRTTPAIQDPTTIFPQFTLQNISRPQPNELRFEMQNAESQAAALINQISASYQLESILISHPSLDDVFLSHTGRALRE